MYFMYSFFFYYNSSFGKGPAQREREGPAIQTTTDFNFKRGPIADCNSHSTNPSSRPRHDAAAADHIVAIKTEGTV